MWILPTRYDELEISGFRFLAAEAEVLEYSLPARLHRRVISIAPGQEDLHGKVVLYSDTYLLKSEPQSFVYARHKSNLGGLLGALDEFFSEKVDDFPELRDRQFRIRLNAGGELMEVYARWPFLIGVPGTKDLRFLRIAFPFGDLCVEFGNPDSEKATIGSSIRQQDMSSVYFGSPLFGFEATRSIFLGALAARIHWASGKIPVEVLDRLITNFASTLPTSPISPILKPVLA
jgi:hypothetical protein